MKPRRLTAVLVAVGLWFAAAPDAHADWQRITAASSSAGEVTLLRVGDVLHVAWRASDGRFRNHLSHRPIAADGTVGPAAPATDNWIELTDPALTAGPDGLRLLFGGHHTSHPDEPNRELNTALSVDGGATWALHDGSISAAGGDAFKSPVGAAAQGDGAPLAAWANGLGTFLHHGLDPATPIVDLQAPLGSQGLRPGVASVGSRTVVAWYSHGSRRGVYAQEIAPDGVAVGGPLAMPGTSETRTPMDARTPVAARAGGKIFIAYATGPSDDRRIRLWSVGSKRSRVIAGADGPSVTTVTAAADGRLWVAWTERSDGRDRVMVRRSNASATRFGKVVDASRPGGGAVAHTLDASDAGGALDLFAGYSRRGSERVTAHHTRVLPGLTLRVRGSRYTVTDAGDPVRGARVSAGRRSATTDGRGRATLRVSAGRTVTASADGYTEDSVRAR